MSAGVEVAFNVESEFKASAQHTADAQQTLVEGGKECMVWLPEHSLGTAPLPLAA